MFILSLLGPLFLFLPVSAVGTEVTGQEIDEISQGNWPTEVTFTDTAVVTNSSAPCGSVMSQLSGPGVASADAHVFTAHPGERFSFRLDSPSKVYTPLCQTFLEGIVLETYLYVDGIGLYDIDVLYQFIDVTDFGFDTDLSDASADVTFHFYGKGIKISDKNEMVDGETAKKIRENASFETIHVTAHARATLVMQPDIEFYVSQVLNYSSLSESPLADSIGFNFKLEETAWEASVLEGDPVKLSGPVTHNDDGWMQEPGFYYHTPSIILIGSNLVSRETLPTDGHDYTSFMETEKLARQRNETQYQNIITRVQYEEQAADNQNTKAQRAKVTLTKGTLARKGPLGIYSLAGLIVLSALTTGGAAVISGLTSAGIDAAETAAMTKTEEKETKHAAELVVNGGMDVPDLLAGCGRPMSVPVRLEGAEDIPVLWSAVVLPDPDEDLRQRLAALWVECAGGNQKGWLSLLCSAVNDDFHATIRVLALAPADRTILASKVVNLQVRTSGIRKTDKAVVLVKEGAVPGSAAETALTPDEYDTFTDENGNIKYVLKENGKENMA